MIKFITNHSMAHNIFHNHSKLQLLNIAKTKFASNSANNNLTFICLLKVRKALTSMVSSDSLHVLKDGFTSTSNKCEFQEVENTVLDSQCGNKLGMFSSSPSSFIL